MSDPACQTAPRAALVTGAAGFIGYHVSRRLLAEGWRVVGLDAVTDYYDVRLKRARLAELGTFEGFRAVEARLEEPGCLAALMAEERPGTVIHLAAQAGVRYSLEAPRSYVEANLVGTFELLDAARAHPPAHLLMASTSSVYGANTDMPYAETDKADTQLSFYAATKKANEAMAHAYAHLHGLPVTMFRFFTVYGPWGRPDMALFRFVRAIRAGEPIDVYNHGRMRRDFTYVDDLVEALVRLIPVAPPPVDAAERRSAVPGDSLSPVAPWRVVNLGASDPVELGAFIDAVEAALGQPAERRLLPMQPGDVPATWADTTLARALVGEIPPTPLAEGIARFVDWYVARYEPLAAGRGP
ncbi:NAD-dependent epimerase/dehydratase family protein [Rhodovulum sp. 12E13]|uniref:NAD-dependent epimerase/dehydratase family protein n=1 Tax=Rhodovulum sp. 12E13 TaxID=2203891 RepID=UPI000E13E2E8|nr:NAD-dependent epimerase/dehydratase family protein [Rhodovulum sp. 12E13]RDC71329.1 NAD-dependent epimerase/dehydratase family protein [Rhodovulum sp. 12E13]